MIPVEEMGELHEKDNEGTGGKPYQIISKETGGPKVSYRKWTRRAGS